MPPSPLASQLPHCPSHSTHSQRRLYTLLDGALLCWLLGVLAVQLQEERGVHATLPLALALAACAAAAFSKLGQVLEGAPPLLRCALTPAASVSAGRPRQSRCSWWPTWECSLARATASAARRAASSTWPTCRCARVGQPGRAALSAACAGRASQRGHCPAVHALLPRVRCARRGQAGAGFPGARRHRTCAAAARPERALTPGVRGRAQHFHPRLPDLLSAYRGTRACLAADK